MKRAWPAGRGTWRVASHGETGHRGAAVTVKPPKPRVSGQGPRGSPSLTCPRAPPAAPRAALRVSAPALIRSSPCHRPGQRHLHGGLTGGLPVSSDSPAPSVPDSTSGPSTAPRTPACPGHSPF